MSGESVCANGRAFPLSACSYWLNSASCGSRPTPGDGDTDEEMGGGESEWGPGGSVPPGMPPCATGVKCDEGTASPAR